MLKGYYKCSEINKMLLRYIHFDLSKNDMTRVARHLRNCPKCMEKYSRIQNRKKELKEKMYKIEKNLRMQSEISSYIDNESDERQKFITEGMLLVDENYKRELFANEEISRLLKQCSRELKRKRIPLITEEIIEKMKKEQRRDMNPIAQLFQLLHHVLAK